ncbi:hypothetical protein N7524_011781 [Penicillium chrysogenum]|nr:hypothetical protein N7524_011781 [Penicillium chrysogenum]
MTAGGGYDQMSLELQAKIDNLFTDSDVYVNWVRAADADNFRVDEWGKAFGECQPPIHRACLMGLVHAVDLLYEGECKFEYFCQCTHRELRHWPLLSSYGIAAKVGNLDLLQHIIAKEAPMTTDNVHDVLQHIDHRKAGKAKLARTLQTLWDRGLLQDGSTNAKETISKHAISATFHNNVSAVEIMSVFLDWSNISTPITNDHLTFAICMMSSDRLARLLFERCDVHVPSDVIEALESGKASSYSSYKTPGLAYLVLERPNELPITDNLVTLFARSETPKVMELLLHGNKERIQVTEGVLEAAAANQRDGDMLCLLWPLREPGTQVNQDMLWIATRNLRHQLEYLQLLLQEAGTDSPLTENPQRFLCDPMRTTKDGVSFVRMLLSLKYSKVLVSGGMLEVICKRRDALEIINLLQKEISVDISVTDDVLCAAASNEEQGPELLSFLAQLTPEPFPVSASILSAAVGNYYKGGIILHTLLQDAPDSLLTDDLFEEACRNPDAMVVLLDQYRREPPVKKLIRKLPRCKYASVGDVVEILLSRNLVNVDEDVVKTLAENFQCLNALLKWKPDSPINQDVLLFLAQKPESFRLVMSLQGDTLTITEDVVMEAATIGSGEVLQCILIRQESLPIANFLMWKAAKRLHPLGFAWLCKQPSVSFLVNFRDKVSEDPEFPCRAQVPLLFAYIERTKTNVTEEMLEQCPYNSETGEDNFFDFFVGWFCEDNNPPNLPATERAAEIIAERCSRDVIKKFLDRTQLQVTESIIKAAEKNIQDDKEEVKSFVEEKRTCFSVQYQTLATHLWPNY